MLFSGKIPFHIAVRLTPRFWVPRFATIFNCSPLFTLFETIRTICTIRYLLFGTIAYWLFATIHYSLFGFSRHPCVEPLSVSENSGWYFSDVFENSLTHWLLELFTKYTFFDILQIFSIEIGQISSKVHVLKKAFAAWQHFFLPIQHFCSAVCRYQDCEIFRRKSDLHL